MKVIVNKAGVYQILFELRDLKKILKKNKMLFADMNGSISMGEDKKDIKKIISKGTFCFYKINKEIKAEFAYTKLLMDFQSKKQNYEKGSVICFNQKSALKDINFNMLYNFRLTDNIYNFYREKAKNNPGNRDWKKEMSDMRRKLLKSK